MQSLTERQRIVALPLRFIAGVAVTLALALAAFYLLMRPPMRDLELMTLFLSITAVISIGVGYGAYRLDWISHAPRISWVLLGSYGLSSALTFVNVWITARLMFASQHDLMLGTVLLLFAGGIAMSLGYFLSTALTSRILTLGHAAKQLAQGKLSTRVSVTGQDEMASLAQAFNEMAAQLEDAAEKQRELDGLRRNLIAWAGHDLRTPLASIRAIVEALADGVVDEPATVQRYLRTAQRDIQALSLLIDDLFQLAQLEAGGLQLEKGLNSISDLISDTLESFSQLAAQQRVKLQGRVAPGVDLVLMDAQHIGRVLSNLVSNALRYTPREGRVWIAAEPRAEGVRVEVHDSGQGIDEKDLPYVFDRFYRGEKSRNRTTGGAGLGLAIAKGIVEAHGGTIGVENRADGGACFYFVLPRR
jgi:signal transduction histidine kinase